ncbi:MAG: hypothetical protein RBJ76_00495 [Stenomitos frigidus ULC029]
MTTPIGVQRDTNIDQRQQANNFAWDLAMARQELRALTLQAKGVLAEANNQG